MKKIFFLLLLTLTTACAPENTEWTYAFYLASGENFYREQNNNYLEICRGAGRVENGRVVVFIDVEPEKGKISRLHLKKGTYAFEVKSCRETKQLDIPSIGLTKKREINLDSSDPDVIKGFFNHIKENYNSKKYFYAIVAHGDTFINPAPSTLNAGSISGALAENRSDVLALDMCYMGGLESLWDLRKSAGIIVAASTTVPLSVNDYTTFLKNTGLPNNTPAETAADFVAAYKTEYGRSRYPISLFALETGTGFINFVADFNRHASEFSAMTASFDSIKPEQRAKSNLYGTNTDLLKGLHTVNQSLEKMLIPSIISSFSINTEFNGPSLFFPVNRKIYEKHRKQYLSTEFSRDNPDWTAFLDMYYKNP